MVCYRQINVISHSSLILSRADLLLSILHIDILPKFFKRKNSAIFEKFESN